MLQNIHPCEGCLELCWQCGELCQSLGEHMCPTVRQGEIFCPTIDVFRTRQRASVFLLKMPFLDPKSNLKHQALCWFRMLLMRVFSIDWMPLLPSIIIAFLCKILTSESVVPSAARCSRISAASQSTWWRSTRACSPSSPAVSPSWTMSFIQAIVEHKPTDYTMSFI